MSQALNFSGRACGMLCHVTSLPGGAGIGDIGVPAHEFLDFLAACGMRFWQILPLGPTAAGLGHSPYMALSSYAGNPLWISLDQLVADGLLSRRDLDGGPEGSEYLVDFPAVESHKKKLLAKAFQEFSRTLPTAFKHFQQNEPWLDDYALFMSRREAAGGIGWQSWRHLHQGCRDAGCEKCATLMADRVLYHQFEQFLFFDQWRKFRSRARQQGIAIIGDLPYYPGMDAAEVWANPEVFQLDKATRQPLAVAGVPPDYFSQEGQLWGNPLYRWFSPDNCPNDQLFGWWIERLEQACLMTDLLRIDHFRAFSSFWAVAAGQKNAVQGSWQPGPGKLFFEAAERKLGPLPLIAEDLGIITPEVEMLRDGCAFPGMKVLQFAFDGDCANNHLPQNFSTTDSVVYTGTHDNDTTVGWYLAGDPATKKRFLRYAGCQSDDAVHRTMLRLAYASTARLAMIPLQDTLGFGSDCRMNRPGVAEGNWRWRAAGHLFSTKLSDWLRDEAQFFNRVSGLKFAAMERQRA